jgi:D-alanine-D-alanine ligase
MTPARVLVLYNQPVLPPDHPDYTSEVEVLDNVHAVSEVLVEAGYEVRQLGVGRDPGPLFQGLQTNRPDVVFNLFEGNGDNNITECYLAGLLEWLNLPFTGCPFQTLVLARSKHLTKRLFQAEGLPTAPFLVVEESLPPDVPLRFPLIVKPATQDGSVGVEQASVVTDLAGLQQRVAHLLRLFGPPVLVEEFIHGRELTMALVEIPELCILPMTEVVFLETQPGYWPILSYDAKWSRESVEYNITDYHFGAQIAPELASNMEAAARRAFRLLGARDYARVDFRVRGDEFFLLELNPNPDFAPDRALANNLWAAGRTHAEFTRQLVCNALARGRDQPQAVYGEQRLPGPRS